MSEFIADLREPTYEDFDNDGFVAELRPMSDHSMEMDPPHCNGVLSNEHLQGLLSNSQFSTGKIAELIQVSTQTLIKKLLYGRSIARIEGQITISMNDEHQPPILINFDHPAGESTTVTKSTRSYPISQVGDELNVNMKRNEMYGELHPDYPRLTSRQSSELAPLKFVDQPYLIPRRGSDADSGYGGRSSDDTDAGQMDMETSRLVPQEERLCPSADSACALMDSDLRYRREPSCEKVTARSLSPDSERWEELEDEGSPLIIDESYDTEALPEPANTASEQDAPREADAGQQVKAMLSTTDVPPHSLDCQHDQDRHSAACHAGSQQRSPSLPVDLSGDSEDPRGSLIPRAQNLVLYSHGKGHGLVCRLCHVVTDNAAELARHAGQTHKLFTCPHCLNSFTAEPHLENHVCVHPRESFHSDKRSPEYLDAQVLEHGGCCRHEEHVLDLSMKKRPELSDDGKLCSARASNVADASKALSSRPGQAVSRDGYRQPGPDSPLSTVGQTNDAHQQHSFDEPEQRIVTIKTEPDLPQNFLNPGSQNVLAIPCETKVSQDEPRSEDMKFPVNIASSKSPTHHHHVTQGRPSIRFSPYSRERLAELTAKFLASRRLVPTTSPKKVPLPVEAALRDENTKSASHQREQPAANVKDEIVREVSMSETALKNRVNAFVKNGGHQGQAETKTSAGSRTVASRADVQKVQGAATGASERAFSCGHEGCGEEFATFQALERHSVDSHGRYLCEHCGKTFTARPNRDRHVRYHTGERPYKCDLCPMAFFRGDDLKYHRTTRHPAAEPFVCNRCNRSFTWNRDLERHQRHCSCKA